MPATWEGSDTRNQLELVILAELPTVHLMHMKYQLIIHLKQLPGFAGSRLLCTMKLGLK